MTAARPDRLTRVFVYGVTVLMCLAAGYYTHKQGTDIPIRDEWYLVPQWLDSGSTAEWAVMHHNEHRYPLGKLLWLGVVRACGYNLKAPMFGTVGLLTAAAVMFQWTAARTRGRVHALDALFPVLLLHWGNGFNLIFGYQIGHALFVYALAGWAWAAGRLAIGGGVGWAVLGAAAAAVVVTCGGYGLAFTPSVVAWFVYLTVRYAKGRRWAWAGGFAAAGLGVGAYSGWVFATMPPSHAPGISPTADPGGFANGFIAYLRLGIGDLEGWGKWSLPLGVVLGVAFAVAVVLAGRRAIRSEHRAVWITILAQVVGTLVIGAAMVRGRGSMQAWYVIVSAVGLVAAVFALTHKLPAVIFRGSRRRLLFALVTKPDATSRRAAWGWMATAVVLCGGLVWANHESGVRTSFFTRVSLADIRDDIAAGHPASVIVGRHGGSYPVLIGDPVTTYMKVFHDAGWPQFRQLAPEPPVSHVPVSLKVPFDLSSDADRGLKEVPLPDPPPRASALRLRAVSVDSTGWQRVAVKWTDVDTGVEHAEYATPSYANGLTVHLMFPLRGKPTGVRFVPVSTIIVLRIETADWLVLPE